MVVITKALGLMYKIPLTHLLGGTGMGYFSGAYAVFTPVFAVAVSGIPSTIARLTAENYAFERYSNLRKLRSVAVRLFFLIGLAASAAVILLSPLLAGKVIHEKNAAWALAAVAPTIALAAVMSVERGYYEGLRNMLPTAVSEIIETVFKLILGLGFAYAAMEYAKRSFETTHGCFGQFCRTAQDAELTALPFVAAASILGATCATGIASAYIIISGRLRGDGITKEMLLQDRITDKTPHMVRMLIKLSMPIAAASVITTLTGMIDLVTINPCLKAAVENGFKWINTGDNSLAAGRLPNFLYGSYTGLALTVYGLVPTLTAMFGKSILPGLAEAWVKKDVMCMQRNISGMLMVSSMIALPSGVGISLMSKEILEFLYGGRTAEIAAADMPLKVLGIAVILSGISIPCFSALQTVGRPKLPVLIMLCGGAVKLTLNIILIPIAGINITGAAISTAVSQGVVCIWSVCALCKAASVSIRVSSVFAKPFFAALLCGSGARICYDLLYIRSGLEINHRAAFAAALAAAFMIYAASLYLLSIFPRGKRFRDLV